MKFRSNRNKRLGLPPAGAALFTSGSCGTGPDVDRRRFICSTVATAAIAATGWIPGQALAARPGGGGGGGGGGTVSRYPLYMPPTASPTSLYALTAAPASVNFGPNRGNALAYNHPGGIVAGFPGPTLVASSGTTTSVAFHNNLSQESTVHWHGMVVPTAQDGQPHEAVLPGQSRNYDFTVNQRAALNWYHPHPHMLTGEQVCLGLAGAFIVRDAEEATLGLPGGVYEVPLILRDANFDRTGNLIYNPRSSGFVGDAPLVNGTLSPTLDVGVALYRLRILNGANARLFRIALSNGKPFLLIGNDGGLLPEVATVNEIEFSPGERLDVLVDFRGMSPGTKVMLHDLNAGWDLLEFVVGTAVSGGIAGQSPSALNPIVALTNPVNTRVFSFDGMRRINGLEFDPNRIDFEVPAHTTEHWRFTTNGNAPHPVHVHGASFQVVARTGGRDRLYPWEAGWKDTVLLKDRETVDVLIRFDSGFTGPTNGRYVLHCHKLEHEDMGMMATFVVI
jgi:FtsP/CotA-like multicopper oxidase with cupredoxin domain